MKKTSKILFATVLCSLTLMNSAESCERSPESKPATSEQNPVPVDRVDAGPGAGPGIGSGGGGTGGSSSPRR